MSDIKHLLSEIGKLALALLPYGLLALWASSIRPDLAPLPALVLALGISINGMLPKRFRLAIFIVSCTALAFVAAAVWQPAAGGVVAASGAVRLFMGALSRQ